ncbi:MAG: histidinol-phosphate transaminase [Planctomycetota bacterium]|nr:histidinol-phosphate transaminase [Planctomycetota bacterium]
MALKYFRENIASLSGYTPGEQPQQGKFIKLNTNENAYPAPESVLQAIRAVDAVRLARYPDPDATAFRAAASTVLGVAEDWILCGNGSDDLLTILVRAFAGEGDAVRYSEPGYVLYPTLCHIQGAVPDPVPYAEDWSLDNRFVAGADHVRLAVIANPNSPSGTMIDSYQIAQFASALPCPLVIDEAYVDFADANALDLVKQWPNLIVTRSLSKSYALAGLRFGYLVAQPEMIGRLSRVKDSYNCDTLSIVGATAAISDQRWRDENRKQIQATRARMNDALTAMGFQIPRSHANFLWCIHPEKSARDIYEQLKNEHILIRYMEYEGWGDGVRITVGTDPQIDALLEVLPEILARI